MVDNFSDRHSLLLYGVRGIEFSGARSTEGASYSSSLDALLGAFSAAQKNAAMRRAASEDDKVGRKLKWAAMGIPAYLIVRTLHVGALELDESTRREAPEFVLDEAGNWAPCLEADEVWMKAARGDEACESTLTQLLLNADRGLVLKPVNGSNSAGVIVLSLAEHDPFSSLPLASGQPREERVRLASSLPSAHLWVAKPNKAIGASESPRSYPLDVWFDALVLQNHTLCGRVDSAPGVKRFIAEPMVAHDYELSVLAVNGGLIVLVSTSNATQRRCSPPDVADLFAAGGTRGGGVTSPRFSPASTVQTERLFIARASIGTLPRAPSPPPLV